MMAHSRQESRESGHGETSWKGVVVAHVRGEGAWTRVLWWRWVEVRA